MESKANKQFLAFIAGQDTDERSALRDALTDITHLCDEKRYDFHDLLTGAREVAYAEDGEEEDLCCEKCGLPMIVNDDGTTNHLKEGTEGVGGLTDVDHDQDADHSALDQNG
mgnify:FL=1